MATMREDYVAIKGILEANGADASLVERIDKEIAKLDNRKSKSHVDNSDVEANILAVMVIGQEYTATQVYKAYCAACPDEEIKSQKIVSCLTSMHGAGTLHREVKKQVSYFSRTV